MSLVETGRSWMARGALGIGGMAPPLLAGKTQEKSTGQPLGANPISQP